jgi:hypothetical protein
VVDNTPNAPDFDPSRPFFENGVWYNYRAVPIGNDDSFDSNTKPAQRQWEQVPVTMEKVDEQQPIGLSKLARVAAGLHPATGGRHAQDNVVLGIDSSPDSPSHMQDSSRNS